jgi:hypothetical protein
MEYYSGLTALCIIASGFSRSAMIALWNNVS